MIKFLNANLGFFRRIMSICTNYFCLDFTYGILILCKMFIL